MHGSGSAWPRRQDYRAAVGPGNDTFTFANTGTLGGKVVGGGHTTKDTVDLSAKVGAVAINLQTNSVTGVAGTVTGVNSFVGNDGTAGANTTFTGGNAGSAYVLTGVNSGTIDGTSSFAGVGNLVDGSGNDSFVLSGGTLIGSIDGGAGTNTLTGDNVVNTWGITAPNTGTVTGISGGFSNIQNLKGGTNTDTFTLASGVATFNGSIAGCGGTDTLGTTDGKNTWVITGAKSGALNTSTVFSGIEKLTDGTRTVHVFWLGWWRWVMLLIFR